MEMMLKVAIIAISAVLLGSIIKKVTPELSLLLMLSVGVCILFLMYSGLEEILKFMRNLAEISEIDQDLLLPVVKTVGISAMTKITGELCRSAGESGVAIYVELAGTVLSLMIALPLVEMVLSMMEAML